MSRIHLVHANHTERGRLGREIHRGGAAGAIYEIAGRPGSVAKIYKDTFITDEFSRRQQEQRVTAMLRNPPAVRPIEIGGETFHQLAWPDALIKDKRGRFIGFSMPKLPMSKAVTLTTLLSSRNRQFEKIGNQIFLRLVAAHHLALVLREMHRCGHFMVDTKPANSAFYREHYFVALLDCDGFSITAKDGTVYPATMYTSQYIAPEVLRASRQIPPTELGEDQDRYALAVIIFRLLNGGIHPYTGQPHSGRLNQLPNEIDQRVKLGSYPYGKTPDRLQLPYDHSIHSYFPNTTLDLFEKSFTKILDRPSAKEWRDELSSLRRDLKHCPQDRRHGMWSKGCPDCGTAKNSKARSRKHQQTQPPPRRRSQPRNASTYPGNVFSAPFILLPPMPAAPSITDIIRMRWSVVKSWWTSGTLPARLRKVDPFYYIIVIAAVLIVVL